MPKWLSILNNQPTLDMWLPLNFFQRSAVKSLHFLSIKIQQKVWISIKQKHHRVCYWLSCVDQVPRSLGFALPSMDLTKATCFRRQSLTNLISNHLYCVCVLDYDAPLSEAGDITPKYLRAREIILEKGLKPQGNKFI